MASSSEKKEITMRAKDFRGAKECIGAVFVTRLRIVSRLSGRKMSRSRRLVKSRVLVGVTGCVRGGRFDRSRLRLDLRETLEDIEVRVGSDGLISFCDMMPIVCEV